MKALTDSSGLAREADALRQRFARDGYLFLPGLLERASVEKVHDDVLTALAQAGWTDDGVVDRTRPGSTRIEGRPEWWEGYTAVQALESFHRLAHSEPLIGVCESLFREAPLVHPRKIARVMWPSPAVAATPAHQDYTHVQGTSDFVTSWIPLHDLEPDVGGLKILEGSWRDGLRPLQPMAGAGGVGIDMDDNHPDWATAEFRAGDVLLFHCFMVHAGRPNRTNGLRVSVDYRYQPLSQPITRESLLPHYRPSVPDWPELTVGWTSTRWIDHPSDTALAEMHWPNGAEGVASWHRELQPASPRLLAV